MSVDLRNKEVIAHFTESAEKEASLQHIEGYVGRSGSNQDRSITCVIQEKISYTKMKA